VSVEPPSNHAVLRALLEAADEGIMVVDNERRVIAVNRRYGELAGVPGEVLATLDHAQITDAAIKALGLPRQINAETDRVHASREVLRNELALPDGRVVERFSAPLALPDGTTAGRVTFFRDVTAERVARRESEAANQAKTAFLAHMSHELRTPLNAVIGFSDLLLMDRGDPLTEQQRDFLQSIVESGRHLLAIVNDVLDIAKVEAGRQDLERTTLEVGEVVAEVVARLAPLAEARGVVLVTAMPRAISISADRVRLRQILYNLISNAVKFTNTGGRVTIATEQRDGQLALRVTDTGIGISEEDVPRLFRAFEQLGRPGAHPGGTGLGLALTKRLVELHDGTIEVTSRPAHGTTFTVTLPITPVVHD